MERKEVWAKDLGERFKLLREVFCLNQAEMADALYISQSGYSQKELGQRKFDSFDIAQTCNLLNISITLFYADLPFKAFRERITALRKSERLCRTGETDESRTTKESSQEKP